MHPTCCSAQRVRFCWPNCPLDVLSPIPRMQPSPGWRATIPNSRRCSPGNWPSWMIWNNGPSTALTYSFTQPSGPQNRPSRIMAQTLKRYMSSPMAPILKRPTATQPSPRAQTGRSNYSSLASIGNARAAQSRSRRSIRSMPGASMHAWPSSAASRPRNSPDQTWPSSRFSTRTIPRSARRYLTGISRRISSCFRHGRNAMASSFARPPRMVCRRLQPIQAASRVSSRPASQARLSPKLATVQPMRMQSRRFWTAQAGSKAHGSARAMISRLDSTGPAGAKGRWSFSATDATLGYHGPSGCFSGGTQGSPQRDKSGLSGSFSGHISVEMAALVFVRQWQDWQIFASLPTTTLAPR